MATYTVITEYQERHAIVRSNQNQCSAIAISFDYLGRRPRRDPITIPRAAPTYAAIPA